MRVGLMGCLLATVPALASGGHVVPFDWSPDGRWIAYTVSGPANPASRPPGWIFEDSGRAASPIEVGADGPRSYRIYAAEVGSGSGVLLEESSGPLTSPSWSPDGRSLAFGRVVKTGAGGRLETVIQDAPGHDRVLVSKDIPKDQPDRFDWPKFVPAWSPDGRYLATPDPNPAATFRVVGVETGQVVKTIEGNSPTWSPDGTRLLFVREVVAAELLALEIGSGRDSKSESGGTPALTFGATKHLFDLGQSLQTPSWTRDGRSVVALSRKVVVRGRGPTPQIDVLRVRMETGLVETLSHLSADTADPEKTLRGACLGFGRDLDDVFTALDLASPPSTIVWCRPKAMTTVDRFNPISFSTRVAALALSPDSKTLAIRFGDDPAGASAALYDLGTKRLTPLAADEPSRREWTLLLLTTAERLLRASLTPPSAGGRPVDRPTLLPVPGEIAANHDAVFHLRKLGRLARPFCDRPGAVGDPSRTGAEFWDEAALFFEALRDDYPAALESLAAVEARTTDPDRLVKLLALRAQLFMGSGDWDKASETVGFLKTIEDAAVSRFEDSPAGPMLVLQPSGAQGWSRYLTLRLDDMKRSNPARGARGEEALAPNGADAAPLPPALQNLPFELLPNGVFNGPRNGPPPARPAAVPPAMRARFARPRGPARFVPEVPPPPPGLR